MKRLVLSAVKGFALCFSVHGAAPAQQPAATGNAQPANPPIQPGPDTSGPAEKIGTQGNWVKKREWLMKSHEAFSEIQDLVNQIEQVRTIFVEKLNNTNGILSNYYTGLGLAEGKIGELFQAVMTHLEHNRTKLLQDIGSSRNEQDPELQAKIDIVESNIKHQRLALDQLKLDMNTVEDLGKSLVDRVNRVDQHILKVQELFIKAQTIVNELWDIIDHNKARTQYYELKINILESLKSEQGYLQTDLLQDFDTVIQTIVAQIGRTEEAIKKIEADGFFIKNRSARLKELKLKEVLSTNTTSTKDAKVKSDVVEKVVQEKTLTERLYATSIEFIAWVMKKMQWLKALILGGPDATQPATVTKKQAPLPVIPTSQGNNANPVPVGPVVPTIPNSSN